MKQFLLNKYVWLILILCLFNPIPSKAFSVFAHMAIVDASWEKSIVPLLKQKYPGITDEQLKVAHSYAYGGSLVADMGYTPFGNVYFTNLVHYVRSGDFVEALIAEARDCNEYAFSLGALSHYLADKYGHSLATNQVVPLLYPKLGAKFGKVVTYEEDHTSHSRTEFSFDVLQTARGNYESQAYHDFIGFNIAKPVLERAFLKTYGEDINDVFGNVDMTISTFRWAVRRLLPGLTRTAWVLKKDDIMKTRPGMTSRKFHYKIKRREYYQEFGKEREKPKFKEKVYAFFLQIVPKIGPFKILKFKDPGKDGEKLFIASFDSVLHNYSFYLAKLHNDHIELPDIDFDTGKPTALNEYILADQTYEQLIDHLQDKKFMGLSSPLKENILTFFSQADSVKISGHDHTVWAKTHTTLMQIKSAPPVPIDSLKMTKAGE